MRSVIFRRPYAPFNVNEQGSVPDEDAARLVALGDAIFAEDTAPVVASAPSAPTAEPQDPPAESDDVVAEKAQRRPPADKQARPGKGGIVTK